MTEFHADDYGLFPTQSGRILRCMREGALNGTSVMPNSPWLEQCLDMLPEEGIALAVHLNLMEGRCLAPKEELPLLTDGEGIFRVSFLRLLLCPLTGRRGEYRGQIKKELRAQIRALQPAFERFGQPLRLDGHAHWHMLPVVFDALMELIAEEELAGALCAVLAASFRDPARLPDQYRQDAAAAHAGRAEPPPPSGESGAHGEKAVHRRAVLRPLRL